MSSVEVCAYCTEDIYRDSENEWHTADDATICPIRSGVRRHTPDLDLRASLARGLAQSAAGETVDLGDFLQYLQVVGEPRGLTFTRGQVEAWVGHALTDEQVADIEEVAPNSSIPIAIETIAHDALEIPYIETCAKCGREIALEIHYGLWYHADSGLPPCDPSQVDPDAYLDIEGDKYDIATPEDGS